MVAQDTYDLGGAGAVVVLGDPALVPLTDLRMRSLTGLTEQTAPPANIDPQGHWDIVSSLRALHGSARTAFLGNRILYFGGAYTGPITMYYIPEHVVDFTLFPAGTAYIDDLFPYHDMIALYAYAQYSARDGELNENLQALLRRRELMLANYLGTRTTEDVSFVERISRSRRSYV